MVTQPKLKGSQDARDMLCNYFSQLTAATSHWYLINNDNTSVVNDFDFSQLVGMTKNEWEAFGLSAGLYERNAEGEAWTTQAMLATAEEVVSDGLKSKLGVKRKLWWPFIDIQNYVVPLLHTLIGIGNDVLYNLKDIVDDKIEVISPTEAKSRISLSTVEDTIKSIIAERDAFDASAAGKELKSCKSKIRTREKALKKLVLHGGNEEEPEVDFQNMSDDDLLHEVDMFVEEADNGDIEEDEDSHEDGDDDTDESATNDSAMEVDGTGAGGNVVDSGGSGDNHNNSNIDAAVAERIQRLRAELLHHKAVAKKHQAQRDAIANRLKKARTLLARVKERIVSMRSERKRKDGMEAKMERVLKGVGVEIQRYHGGSLTGKDILKVVANANHIFDEFAKIFIEHKRKDCVLSDDEIRQLCEDHKRALLLWDGAFSHARTVDPTAHDFAMYQRYINGAVYYHIKIGCSITPKVHLMLKHALKQMKAFEGGLGDKAEDWVEHMHQSGNRLRVRFRTVKSLNVRAKAMSRAIQMDSNPALNEQIKGVHGRASTKSQSNNVDSKRKERVERRIAALTAYETTRAAV